MSSTRHFSTAEVAKEIKVAKSTLLRWLHTGQVEEPRREVFGGVSVRVWTEKDIARVQRFRDNTYNKKPRTKAK